MKQPEWITEPLTPYDIAAINQGGCASGAYMPAVTYYDAAQTMAKHGDAVLDYLEEQYGELPIIPDGTSWSDMAVLYLSWAVELWCREHYELADWEDATPIEAIT